MTDAGGNFYNVASLRLFLDFIINFTTTKMSPR